MKLTIETKYNIGDTVYCLLNKIHEFKIMSYRVDIVPERIRISYSLDNENNSVHTYTVKPEDECYSTKEELIKSLL